MTSVRSLRYEEFLVAAKNLDIPIVQLPGDLLPHPLRGRGIVLHALLGFYTPSHNIKYIPASYMLEKKVSGRSVDAAWTFVENSSGNFAVSLAACARVRGLRVTAIVSDDLADGKLQPLLASDVDVVSESEARLLLATRTGSGSELARLMGKRRNWINLGQYTNSDNPESYAELLAPAAIRALNGGIQVFSAGLGSAGTFVGLGGTIKHRIPGLKMIAVIPHLGEAIPGCRDDRRLTEVTHDWQSYADCIRYVDAASAYNVSLQMWRAGVPAGPSSGAALLGLCNYLIEVCSEDRLARLRGPDGMIHCLFPCADTLSLYWNEVRKLVLKSPDCVKLAS